LVLVVVQRNELCSKTKDNSNLNEFYFFFLFSLFFFFLINYLVWPKKFKVKTQNIKKINNQTHISQKLIFYSILWIFCILDSWLNKSNIELGDGFIKRSRFQAEKSVREFTRNEEEKKSMKKKKMKLKNDRDRKTDLSFSRQIFAKKKKKKKKMAEKKKDKQKKQKNVLAPAKF